jgi:uncharacterized membrane protein
VSEARLFRVIEAVLTIGLLTSAALLAIGVFTSQEPLLRWGLLLLMLTPAARVVVLTVGLLLERDWVFAAISVWVLLVLASSLSVALRS